MCLNFLKCDDRNFCICAKSYGKCAAETYIYVHCLSVFVVATIGVGESPRGGSPSEKFDLCGVGVSAKCERNVGLSDHFTAPVAWVVGEKYAESVGVLHRLWQIAHIDGAEALVRAVFVVNTDDGYLLPVALNSEVVVSQQMPAESVAL